MDAGRHRRAAVGGSRYYTQMTSADTPRGPAAAAPAAAAAIGAPAGAAIRDAVAAIAAGRTSSRALLESARDAHARNVELNAIAWVDWDAAARAADALDAEARAGRALGPLHGATVSIKDLYNVAGMPSAGGTRATLPDFGGESVAVSRLRAAGALLFAKTNMHEIALGATGENAWTGDVKNPHDPARQAGGSSSGAGVAVATGIGLAGLGSDTGGSVRIPAAFCGVVGFKPSFGAIPLAGALHLSWTCDHAGPLTRSVDDAALLYEVMSGRRADHGAVARRPRLAVPAQWLKGRLHPAMRAWFEAHVGALRARADIVEVDTPSLPLAWQHYTPIVRAEGAYVHRAVLADGGQGFSESVLAPLRAGEQVSAQVYIDALQQREVVRRELDALLRDHDALLLPTSAVPTPLRGQTEVEVESGTMSVREAVLGQTLAFSFVGLPTLSLPAGTVERMPAGLQVVGARDRDASLLALCRWLEAGLAPTA
jgi:aspartyl-tRNA(Asn)/glutamyl-tRNA(Gln) amidotransferase subunit A